MHNWLYKSTKSGHLGHAYNPGVDCSEKLHASGEGHGSLCLSLGIVYTELQEKLNGLPTNMLILHMSCN
jgi:hypothetical protein